MNQGLCGSGNCWGRKQVEDVEAAIMQEQEAMRNAEQAWSTSSMPEIIFEQALNAIGHSLSDPAGPNHDRDWEYEQEN